MQLRYLSMSQLAEVTGLDRRTVKARLAKIKPHESKTKLILYDAWLALPSLYKSEVGNIAEQSALESLRLEKARADKIELEIARVRGGQVPIEDVALVVEKEYSRVRSSLLSIPTKLARDLSQIDDPRKIQIELETVINDCLSELSADRTYRETEIPENKEEISERDSIDSSEIGNS
jgi:phage terminase Nu1 subunit (DNA packaging protein)